MVEIRAADVGLLFLKMTSLSC